jgi:hypothetical protein
MEEAGKSQITRGTPRWQMPALIICVLAANAVFIGQAYHMDDSIYLLLARNAATSPWFPQDASIYFEGLYAPDLASTEHPVPVTSYYMALINHFVHRFKELDLHLAFLVFPLVLSCAMFVLARRYTKHPFMATLTLMLLPALYVLSHTLMTDVPQLALWVASTAIFMHGTESRNTVLIVAAAFTVALACFVSYASFCLIPLLAVPAISRKNYRDLLVILIVPGVVLGAWLAVSFLHYGRVPPAHILSAYFAVKRVLSPVLLLEKVTYIVLAIGGVMIFPFGLLAASRKPAIAVAMLLAAPAMWISGALQYSPVQKLMFIFFFCAGLGAIAGIVGDFISGRERELFLGAWFIGMLLFTATFYMTGSARYLFSAMPPFVVLFYRRLERLWDRQKLLWIAWTNLVLAASLAVLLAAADYQFAGIYRDFASTLHKTYSVAQRRTWFAGEWGLRAYLESSGAQEVGRRDARPRKGDLLVIPTQATPYVTLFDERLSLDSIVLVAPSKVRFPVPRISGETFLTFTVGMPFPEKSDGVNLRISFDAPDGGRQIYWDRITPAAGSNWTTQQVPLRDMLKGGDIVFSSEVGGSNNVADWIALARARIFTQTGSGQAVLYDFREHLADAAVESVPGLEYQTPGNLPIFPMTVWLSQQPARILRGVYSYRISSPIRLLDASVHAGFWSMGWGILPFSFAGQDSTLETIRVYEISRDIDSYGEREPDWYGSP